MLQVGLLGLYQPNSASLRNVLCGEADEQHILTVVKYKVQNMKSDPDYKGHDINPITAIFIIAIKI